MAVKYSYTAKLGDPLFALEVTSGWNQRDGVRVFTTEQGLKHAVGAIERDNEFWIRQNCPGNVTTWRVLSCSSPQWVRV